MGGVRLAMRGPHSRSTQLDNLRRAAGTAATKLGGARTDAHILLSGFEAVPSPVLRAPLEPAHASHKRQNPNLWGPVTLVTRAMTATLTEMHYLPCEPFEATAQLVRPDDPTIYATAAAWGNTSRTDPAITAWELAQGPQSNQVQILALRDWPKKFAATH